MTVTFTRDEVLGLLSAAWSVSHEPTAIMHVVERGADGSTARNSYPAESAADYAEVQLSEYEASPPKCLALRGGRALRLHGLPDGKVRWVWNYCPDCGREGGHPGNDGIGGLRCG